MTLCVWMRTAGCGPFWSARLKRTPSFFERLIATGWVPVELEDKGSDRTQVLGRLWPNLQPCFKAMARSWAPRVKPPSLCCGVLRVRQVLPTSFSLPASMLPNKRGSGQALFGCGFAAMMIVCLQLN